MILWQWWWRQWWLEANSSGRCSVWGVHATNRLCSCCSLFANNIIVAIIIFEFNSFLFFLSANMLILQLPVHGQREIREWLHGLLQACRESKRRDLQCLCTHCQEVSCSSRKCYIYLTTELSQVEETSSKHRKELGARGRCSNGAGHKEHLQTEEEGEPSALWEAIQVQARLQAEAVEDEEERGAEDGRAPPGAGAHVSNETSLESIILLNARIPGQLLLETTDDVLRGGLPGQAGWGHAGPAPLSTLLQEWQAWSDPEPDWSVDGTPCFFAALTFNLGAACLPLLLLLCIFILPCSFLHRKLGWGGTPSLPGIWLLYHLLLAWLTQLIKV